MSDTWRLIKSPPASGAWNMAVDEAILLAIQENHVLPTLRLYAWIPACLSLGYAQPFSDVDIDQIQDRGWHIVRRVTGGRAILHTDELTYSVAGPQDEPRFSGGVLQSYRRLSEAILKALLKLGLPVEALPKHENTGGNIGSKDPVCFEIPSNYEITVQGKKLVGSAQARKKGAVLQHGTIPLYGDITRITKVLTFQDQEGKKRAAERLQLRATNLESVLNRIVSWDEAADLFISAFQDTFHLQFQLSDLTPKERSNAKRLLKEKYELESWIKRI
jgi:lipoate-protein ligase A